MPILSVAPAVVDIRGASYAVEPIAAGFAGVAAVRVVKLVNGESYDVVRRADGLVECSCPDFVCRHEGKGTFCKHGAAMVARGLLPVPPAMVAPITQADLKRAAMWGLKLPAAPIAVETPVPVAPAADDQADEDAGHYEPSGDSWETWTKDDGRWPTTEDPARSDIDLTGFCRATTPAAGVDLVFAELAVGFLTDAALGLIDEGRPEEAAAIFAGLEDDNRAAFGAFLASVGSPVATWGAWVDLCVNGSPVSFPEPPAHRPGRFAPTAELDAERLGFELGNAGEEAAPRARTAREADAFRRGWYAGKAALEAERNAYLDALEADRDEPGFAELADAGGVYLARAWSR